MFLTGRCYHQLDDKGRIRIPSKFKDALGEHPFITIGKNKCLYVFSKEEAEHILGERFAAVDGFEEGNQLDSMRDIFSSGDFVDEDKQGRITLPSYLLEDAGITKNVVSVGMRNRIEIWAEDVWNDYYASIRQGVTAKKAE